MVEGNDREFYNMNSVVSSMQTQMKDNNDPSWTLFLDHCNIVMVFNELDVKFLVSDNPSTYSICQDTFFDVIEDNMNTRVVFSRAQKSILRQTFKREVSVNKEFSRLLAEHSMDEFPHKNEKAKQIYEFFTDTV